MGGRKSICVVCIQTTCCPCDSLLGKPFWISDRQQHKLENTRTKGKCCFNHIIKLPQKDGMLRPIYPYEMS